VESLVFVPVAAMKATSLLVDDDPGALEGPKAPPAARSADR